MILPPECKLGVSESDAVNISNSGTQSDSDTERWRFDSSLLSVSLKRVLTSLSALSSFGPTSSDAVRLHLSSFTFLYQLHECFFVCLFVLITVFLNKFCFAYVKTKV